MKRAALVALLFVFSMPTLAADQWLCIGEQGAKVKTSETQVFGSESFRNENKFLVSKDGVKNFGSDKYFLDKCNFIEGRPGYCELKEGFGGFFRMGAGNIFTILFIAFDEDDVTEYWLVSGKCSRL